jgi:adenine C2-methylase RlmN of 23S rRNA A2503 and tRNA A37
MKRVRLAFRSRGGETTFRDALSRHVGQPVVRRYSGGKDIQAACGTLAGLA